MTKYVYSFDENKKIKKELLGEVGYKLSEMTKVGLPVINGFTITTEAFTRYYDNNKVIDEILVQIFDEITELENKTGKKLGDPTNPLLLFLELDSKQSKKIYNIGINDQIIEKLFNITNNYVFVYDLYVKFIYRFTEIVKKGYGMVPYINIDTYNNILEPEELKQKLKEEMELIKLKYKNTFNEEFPQDPKEQLAIIIKSIFKSSINEIDDNGKTAINIQEVLLGNYMAYIKLLTRNPFSGKNELYLENSRSFYFRSHITVLEMVCDYLSDANLYLTGRELLHMLRDYKELSEYAKRIEKYYNNMQYIEFVVANDKLLIKQVGNGQRTMFAAQKIAEDIRNERLQLKQAQESAMKEIENLIFSFRDEPDKEHILVKIQKAYESIKQISIFDGLFVSKKNLHIDPVNNTVKSKIKRKLN